MHGWLLFVGVILAVGLRLTTRFFPWHPPADLRQRWQVVLSQFLLPPLLLLTTGIAILKMGHHGHMLGQSVGRFGCHLVMVLGASAWGYLAFLLLTRLLSFIKIHQLPRDTVQGSEVRRLDIALPFAGCIGFWNADLVVSPALTEQLTEDEVDAVLLHEQGHLIHRDTFWFFWLGWVRQLTAWLPRTEELWQELLLLRELRADRWAAQFTDPLLIAETLLKLTQASAAEEPLPLSAACFTEAEEMTRLEARINALVQVSATSPSAGVRSSAPSLYWFWAVSAVCLSLLPLLSELCHSM